ncbi:hypothetical protein M514_03683 [Trichuris suis]|uniref:Uncharacterized protein n=1 Tax=Trichuris suis TaxID=68888 RepID=A0A085NGS1_9BILA|nr:hypothetical protein M513_03683 [Trichuris suis]KFD68667.1 hypothetical protein M514_03683 [Trichuris suis]
MAREPDGNDQDYGTINNVKTDDSTVRGAEGNKPSGVNQQQEVTVPLANTLVNIRQSSEQLLRKRWYKPACRG